MGSTPTRSRHLLGVVAAVLWTVGWAGSAFAQEPVVQDPDPTSADTASVASVAASGPQSGKESAGPPVSPMGALLRSMVLPGWGQAAVDQPVRGAFYFTMEAASLWMLFKTQAKLDAAKRAGNEDLASSRQDQKEDWIVMAVFWSLFAGVDAWVSTHLWDFEGAVVPPPDGSRGIAVQYSVPVGGP